MGDVKRQMRRQDVYDLTQKYRRGDFNKPTDPNILTPIKENGVHSFYNATSRDLVKGCFVCVEHAYLNGVSYGEAQSRILSNTYCLHCVDLPEDVYNDQVVRVRSATPVGRMGTAYSEDFIFAPVQNAEGASYAVLKPGKSWLTGVADETQFQQTDVLRFWIYDRSLPETFESGETYSYCLLFETKIQPSSVRTVYIASDWTQNESRTSAISVYYYDAYGTQVTLSAYSPMSKKGDTFKAGTLAVVAQIPFGEWVIINAECD